MSRSHLYAQCALSGTPIETNDLVVMVDTIVDDGVTKPMWPYLKGKYNGRLGLIMPDGSNTPEKPKGVLEGKAMIHSALLDSLARNHVFDISLMHSGVSYKEAHAQIPTFSKLISDMFSHIKMHDLSPSSLDYDLHMTIQDHQEPLSMLLSYHINDDIYTASGKDFVTNLITCMDNAKGTDQVEEFLSDYLTYLLMADIMQLNGRSWPCETVGHLDMNKDAIKRTLSASLRMMK